MSESSQTITNLVQVAKDLHSKERHITSESVFLVGEFERRRAALHLGMASEKFAILIGLTPNQYWKRAQAARVIQFFPKSLAMVEAGETQISLLALIAPKITQKNADILLDGIKNKTKRDVEGLLSRTTLDGAVLEREAEFELRLKLTESQMQLFDRSREVLSHSGHIPTQQEIIVKSLEDLLRRRDPLQKAKRAALKKVMSKLPSPGKEGPAIRSNVPAHVEHTVRMRDGAQCTWLFGDGSRCPERMMLELDHITMRCHGGVHSAENLTLRCRRHNQFAAELKLGAKFMDQKRRKILISFPREGPNKATT